MRNLNRKNIGRKEIKISLEIQFGHLNFKDGICPHLIEFGSGFQANHLVYTTELGFYKLENPMNLSLMMCKLCTNFKNFYFF